MILSGQLSVKVLSMILVTCSNGLLTICVGFDLLIREKEFMPSFAILEQIASVVLNDLFIVMVFLFLNVI